MVVAFAATHKLVAPGGEQLPVMLLSQAESVRYLVKTLHEYEESSLPIYEWHPTEGITYQGYQLQGLQLMPLESSVECLEGQMREPASIRKQRRWQKMQPLENQPVAFAVAH